MPDDEEPRRGRLVDSCVDNISGAEDKVEAASPDGKESEGPCIPRAETYGAHPRSVARLTFSVVA